MNFHPNPDAGAVIALLAQANLPTTDITPELLTRFIGAGSREMLKGVIGYEAHAQLGLLRSLAVSTEAQGAGLGALLVEQIEAAAASEGITQLFLLTTDADRYFASRNYHVIERDNVPAAIRSTTQFSSLCPDSATVMVKVL